jgi:hypothetical protein
MVHLGKLASREETQDSFYSDLQTAMNNRVK